jgi:hypothetical protein
VRLVLDLSPSDSDSDRHLVDSSAVARPQARAKFAELLRKATKLGGQQSPAGERSNSGADGLVSTTHPNIFQLSYCI